MKVGDYVRTKNGIIGKIESKNLIGYNDWIIDTLYYNDDEIIDDWTCGIKEYDIIKSSPNIIDLIEAGDYVNGEKIDSVLGNEELLTEAITNAGIDGRIINSSDIETVVTKEQFESMEYKIGSE